MFRTQTAAQFLNFIFEKRIQDSPGYTLRAFAIDAGVSAAQMSLVLRSKAGLSSKTALHVCEKLKLTKFERDFFLALVDSQYSRSAQRRAKAQDALDGLADQLFESKKYAVQNKANFKMLEDWLHLTLFEVIRGRSGFKSVNQLSSILGRSIEDLEKALQALIDSQLVELSESGYICKQELILFQPGIPAKTIRNAHRSLIEKSLQALDADQVSERNFGSYIFGIEEAKYNELCRRLDELMDEFVVNHQTSKDMNRVYSLCFQLFPVTKRI
jgi:uncharacterized protein (TIGR02147 family)